MHRIRGAMTAIVAAMVFVPGAAVAAPVESFAPLVTTSAERVEIADKVAAAKFGTDQPIADPERERQVLDAAARKAEAMGVDPTVAVRVFRDQIEANKLVQRGLISYWTAHPEQAPTERPDLPTEVRPVLDRITDELLTEIRDTPTLRAKPTCAAHLATDSARVGVERRMDPLHAAALARALPSVCQSR